MILVDGLNKRLSAEFRATVNSLVSLGTRAAFILVGPLLGFVVDGYGAEVAMLVLAVLFAPTMVVVLMILFNGISNEDTAREKETAGNVGLRLIADMNLALVAVTRREYVLVGSAPASLRETVTATNHQIHVLKIIAVSQSDFQPETSTAANTGQC